jgi:hypothetical protein
MGLDTVLKINPKTVFNVFDILIKNIAYEEE